MQEKELRRISTLEQKAFRLPGTHVFPWNRVEASKDLVEALIAQDTDRFMSLYDPNVGPFVYCNMNEIILDRKDQTWLMSFDKLPLWLFATIAGSLQIVNFFLDKYEIFMMEDSFYIRRLFQFYFELLKRDAHRSNGNTSMFNTQRSSHVLLKSLQIIRSLKTYDYDALLIFHMIEHPEFHGIASNMILEGPAPLLYDTANNALLEPGGLQERISLLYKAMSVSAFPIIEAYCLEYPDILNTHKNVFEMYPLHVACIRLDMRLIQCLLHYGASKTLRCFTLKRPMVPYQIFAKVCDELLMEYEYLYAVYRGDMRSDTFLEDLTRFESHCHSLGLTLEPNLFEIFQKSADFLERLKQPIRGILQILYDPYTYLKIDYTGPMLEQMRGIYFTELIQHPLVYEEVKRFEQPKASKQTMEEPNLIVFDPGLYLACERPEFTVV